MNLFAGIGRIGDLLIQLLLAPRSCAPKNFQASSVVLSDSSIVTFFQCFFLPFLSFFCDIIVRGDSIESEFFVISDACTCNLDVLIEKFDWCLWIVIFSSFFFHISFAYFFFKER